MILFNLDKFKDINNYYFTSSDLQLVLGAPYYSIKKENDYVIIVNSDLIYTLRKTIHLYLSLSTIRRRLIQLSHLQILKKVSSNCYTLNREFYKEKVDTSY